MNTRKAPNSRQRGSIETLESGSLRVRVYSGIDPLVKRRNYLEEVIPLKKTASVKEQREAWAEAERIRRRLITEVDERRNPRTKATVNQLLDKYYNPKQVRLNIETRTRSIDEGRVNNHIRPLIGDVPVAKLDADIFDSFYAQLQHCSKHCNGKTFTEHRTDWPHQCDNRCQPHNCKPLSNSSILNIHAILSGALKQAVRWKWIAVNPISQADPPPPPVPDPNPPSSEEMSQLLNEAWNQDPDWGVLVWLAMRTGARRGEICAWSWDRLDLNAGILRIETSIAQDGNKTWEKPTKTSRKRRVALSKIDLDLLTIYKDRCEHRTAQLGLRIDPNGRLFSRAPDHSTWCIPDTISQRYKRMCLRLGIDSTLKSLRHYSATELIAAGVDVRTVAGRLGHAGGGTTTLKVYSAFVDEANQRASDLTSERMPVLPEAAHRVPADELAPAIPDEPSAPYERIASDLAGAIRAGLLVSGDCIPSEKVLAARYEVAASTAHRAIELLKKDGLVKVSSGAPTTVTQNASAL